MAYINDIIGKQGSSVDSLKILNWKPFRFDVLSLIYFVRYHHISTFHFYNKMKINKHNFEEKVVCIINSPLPSACFSKIIFK